MDKVYVDVLAVFSREGDLIPKAFVWEDGHRYEIDKISKPERCASRKAGGTGYRYTCMVEGKICHLTYEEIKNSQNRNISSRGYILSRENRLLYIYHIVSGQPEMKTIPL